MLDDKSFSMLEKIVKALGKVTKEVGTNMIEELKEPAPSRKSKNEFYNCMDDRPDWQKESGYTPPWKQGCYASEFDYNLRMLEEDNKR